MKTMSNKRQTAVEWLADYVMRHLSMSQETIEAINKAKEIEKEQIVDAIVQHQIKHHELWSEKGILKAVSQAEHYYNQTYNTPQP